jgi:hypothetical protein
MKILALQFSGAEPKVLFTDVRLENLRRLMDMGCFGELSDSAEWDVLARQENHTLTLLEFFQQAGQPSASFDDSASLRTKLEAGDWEYCQLRDQSFPAENWSADDYLNLDRELGEVLQYLSDDTIIAILGKGCFVLISANNPISGEYKNGLSADLAPTLLELAGYPLSASTEGKSWVAGMELKSTSGLTAEEEEILRDRLSGLGYI